MVENAHSVSRVKCFLTSTHSVQPSLSAACDVISTPDSEMGLYRDMCMRRRVLLVLLSGQFGGEESFQTPLGVDGTHEEGIFYRGILLLHWQPLSFQPAFLTRTRYQNPTAVS